MDPWAATAAVLAWASVALLAWAVFTAATVASRAASNQKAGTELFAPVTADHDLYLLNHQPDLLVQTDSPRGSRHRHRHRPRRARAPARARAQTPTPARKFSSPQLRPAVPIHALPVHAKPAPAPYARRAATLLRAGDSSHPHDLGPSQFEQDVEVEKSVTEFKTAREALEHRARPENLRHPKDRQLMNRYVREICDYTAMELMTHVRQRLAETTNEAMDRTVESLKGQILSVEYVKDVAMRATFRQLDQLLFQLQMTGYMFANAEDAYNSREKELEETLRAKKNQILLANSTEVLLPSRLTVTKTQVPRFSRRVDEEIAQVEEKGLAHDSLDVNSASYYGSRAGEAQHLQRLLLLNHDAKAQGLRATIKDMSLIQFINSRSKEDQQDFTDAPKEVLESMHTLARVTLQGMGINVNSEDPESETILLESEDAVHTMLLWHLIIGYRLRQVESVFEKQEEEVRKWM